MADYFTQWSVPLVLETREEIKWVKRVYADLLRMCELAEDLSSDDDHKEYHLIKKKLGDMAPSFCEGAMHDYVSFEFDVELAPDKKSGVAYFMSEENGDIEQVAVVLRDFLEKFHPDRSVGFEWAATCSKMRPDGFGGGAVFVTAQDIKYMSTNVWLEEQQKLSEKKAHK